MASLLSKTTSAQLGIGGDAGDFATGVKKKKKAITALTQEEQVAGQVGQETGDARLAAQADVDVSYDPKADSGASLMLTTDDEAFINQVQQLKSDLFSGQYKGGGGSKGDAAGFFAMADASSRGGLGDVWNDAINALYKGEMGGKKLAAAQEAFTQAYEKTSRVLNLDVDMGTYQFDPGTGAPGTYGKDIKGAKGERTAESKAAFQTAKQTTKERAKAGAGSSAGAYGTFAWDVAADVGQDQLGIAGSQKKRGGLGIR
jgi:hypothetical protein